MSAKRTRGVGVGGRAGAATRSVGRVGVWALGCLLSSGCAQRLSGPDAGGEKCDRDLDCNRVDGGGVRACGALRACVAGRCEAVVPDAATVGAWVRVCGPDGDDAGH